MNDIGEEVNLQEKVRKEKPFERLGGNLNAFGAPNVIFYVSENQLKRLVTPLSILPVTLPNPRIDLSLFRI